MRRFLIVGVIVLAVLIVVSRATRFVSSPQLLPFGVGLGLGAAAGAAWARAHRAHTDWRGARRALPRLRGDLLARGRTLAGVAAAVTGVALVIVALTKGH